MFSAHASESDWQWAAKPRTLFKTSIVGVLTGIGTLFVRMLARGAFSDPNWLQASVIPAVNAIIVAAPLPQVETWWFWRGRHKVRLEDTSPPPALMSGY